MITFLLTVRKASIHSGLMFSVCVWGGRGEVNWALVFSILHWITTPFMVWGTKSLTFAWNLPVG